MLSEKEDTYLPQGAYEIHGRKSECIKWIKGSSAMRLAFVVINDGRGGYARAEKETVNFGLNQQTIEIIEFKRIFSKIIAKQKHKKLRDFMDAFPDLILTVKSGIDGRIYDANTDLPKKQGFKCSYNILQG